jgi:hypothetical protein
LAAIEALVTVATKFGHKEAEFFSKAYTHCKKFEDSKNIGNLAMKLRQSYFLQNKYCPIRKGTCMHMLKYLIK